MLDMSKLPSHKIENGVVIFDEPCSIACAEIKSAMLDCDSIVFKEGFTWDEAQIYAIASTKEYNKQVAFLFGSLSKEIYSWMRHTGLKEETILTIS